MSVEEIKGWVGIVVGTIALLGHLKGYFSSGETKLNDDLSDVKSDLQTAEKTLIDHDRRIQEVENEMRHLPDRESQHRIEINLVEVSARIDVLAESLKPIKANNELITELLKRQAEK